MKVKAKHWLNANGEWHRAGDEFDVESIAGMEDSVEVVADTQSRKPEKSNDGAAAEEAQAEAPKRRGRSRQ